METIKLLNISKSFRTLHTQINILNNINITLLQKEITAIVGPSGSGKSTLLSIIGTLDVPTGGTLLIGNKNVSKMKATQLANIRFSDMGFIFQQFHLVSSLTVLENVLSPLFMRKVGFNKQERAVSLLKRVGLQNHIRKLPSQLSGGQMQRVAIARALINKPKWILADEPTGNLDSETSNMIIDLLKEIHEEENCGVVMVTHDPYIARNCDRILKLQDGEIISDERREHLDIIHGQEVDQT
jgi:ABC-type lipoprotein export system ATPase subunit